MGMEPRRVLRVGMWHSKHDAWLAFEITYAEAISPSVINGH